MLTRSTASASTTATAWSTASPTTGSAWTTAIRRDDTGVSALRSAADDVEAERGRHGGEPQDQRDDQRDQPAVAVLGVLGRCCSSTGWLTVSASAVSWALV